MTSETNIVEFERFDVLSSNHKNILLVEDNDEDVEEFRMNCESSGYPCSTYITWNGEEALKFLDLTETQIPDIIILDINMPRMDGLTALKHIRENSELNQVPILILTSSRLSPDIARAKEAGANGYIVKPINNSISELLGFIDLVKSSPDTFLEFADGGV